MDVPPPPPDDDEFAPPLPPPPPPPPPPRQIVPPPPPRVAPPMERKQESADYKEAILQSDEAEQQAKRPKRVDTYYDDHSNQDYASLVKKDELTLMVRTLFPRHTCRAWRSPRS